MAFSDLYNFPFDKGDEIYVGGMAALKLACEQFVGDKYNADCGAWPSHPTFMGLEVVKDASLPRDVVEVRSRGGLVLGRIIGIGE